MITDFDPSHICVNTPQRKTLYFSSLCFLYFFVCRALRLNYAPMVFLGGRKLLGMSGLGGVVWGMGGTTNHPTKQHNRLIVNDRQPSFSGNRAPITPQLRDTEKEKQC